MQPRHLPFGALVFALLMQLTPVQPRAWVFKQERLEPTLLSAGITPLDLPARADFDMDGHPETISIFEGTASLTSGGKVVWASPSDWQVEQAGMTDLNGDGAAEMTLLVWRPFRAWPVDQWLPEGGRIDSFQDAAGNSCQLILIGWQKGGYRELWAGSALAEPVKAFATADLDGDGRQELVTLEGRYSDSRSAPARALKIWEWNGFGFSSVYGMAGRFTTLALARSRAGQTLILVP
jgi:hypothetical protein